MIKPLCDSNSSFLSSMLSKSDTLYKGRHCLITADFTMVTIVPYGEYKFVIEATAIKDGEEIKAEASGKVMVLPPYPTLTELVFEDTTKIDYDDGQNVGRVLKTHEHF
jgi:hypothetical protein